MMKLKPSKIQYSSKKATKGYEYKAYTFKKVFCLKEIQLNGYEGEHYYQSLSALQQAKRDIYTPHVTKEFEVYAVVYKKKYPTYSNVTQQKRWRIG